MRYGSMFVFALVLAGCTAKREAGDVTVEQLFDRPNQFDGKQVSVVGYYVYEYEHENLCASPQEDIQEHLLPDGVFARRIWVSPGWRRSGRLKDHYVRVVGIFHYRPQFRRTMEKRQDGSEFESIFPQGYGHMGLWPAEISEVSSFRPLR